MEGKTLANDGLRVPRKAGREDTRTTNLRLVLQHLFSGDVLSRAELARATELTPATVSTLVAELEASGLIGEAGTRRASSQVGKPPTMYEIKPEARSTVALDLSDPETFRGAVVDLSGRIESRTETAITSSGGPDVIEQVKHLVAETIDRATSPIVGIGIGTPGLVSADGMVVEASTFDWHQVPLRDELETATGQPVHIANDANVAAIAEYTQGVRGRTNLALVRIGSGVGAGLVLGGQLFLGDHSAAGEIGHLVVDEDGPPCRCGLRGCLETFVSLPAIEAMIKATATPSETARRYAAERLGIALAAIVAVLNIEHILIAAPTDALGQDFCQIVEASLRTRCYHAMAESVVVDYTSLGPDIVLLGAAGLVLSQELGVV